MLLVNALSHRLHLVAFLDFWVHLSDILLMLDFCVYVFFVASRT